MGERVPGGGGRRIYPDTKGILEIGGGEGLGGGEKRFIHSLASEIN